MDFVTTLLFIGWMACIGLGGYVSFQKARPIGEGIVFCVILGPLGVLVAALMLWSPAWKADRREPRGYGVVESHGAGPG